ncbi:hypothetical protein KP77_21030 [Jeotgalibacillus alimentarius]|uniref:Uncharacterized protein n=1 Tax=Jeotgalibacillus alimentarius TaxID=135826 RepID=A0A0C2VJ30_9BACL|nr:hypothetical protein KP77_21030 [Jeotgalibacillus alimentarius]
MIKFGVESMRKLLLLLFFFVIGATAYVFSAIGDQLSVL